MMVGRNFSQRAVYLLAQDFLYLWIVHWHWNNVNAIAGKGFRYKVCRLEGLVLGLYAYNSHALSLPSYLWAARQLLSTGLVSQH